MNDIDFSRRGLKETLKWNPKQAQNFPDLINDIKNATKIPDAPNLKPEQKPFATNYELYQAKNGLIKPHKQQNYTGYKNQINGTSQIYTREEIGAMPLDEFEKNQEAIWSQMNSIGIPTNNELQQSSSNGGGTIYVKPYRRSDGLK